MHNHLDKLSDSNQTTSRKENAIIQTQNSKLEVTIDNDTDDNDIHPERQRKKSTYNGIDTP